MHHWSEHFSVISLARITRLVVLVKVTPGNAGKKKLAIVKIKVTGITRAWRSLSLHYHEWAKAPVQT